MNIFRGGLKYLWISAIYRRVWSLTLMNTGGRLYKSLEKWFSLLTSGSHVDCLFFFVFFKKVYFANLLHIMFSNRRLSMLCSLANDLLLSHQCFWKLSRTAH